jgi:deazaflavin-dependent oxidoreductase (nitroreductase family)
MTRQAAVPPTWKDTFVRKLVQFGLGIYRWLYRQTAGKVGHDFRGGTVLLLTTTGRKTGKARTWPVMYFVDGERFVVVGSNGGLDRDPAWCHNLRSNPSALIEIGNKQLAVRAEEAQGEEWNRLWQLVTTQAPFFDGYRTATRRTIPLMILHPEQ